MYSGRAALLVFFQDMIGAIGTGFMVCQSMLRATTIIGGVGYVGKKSLRNDTRVCSVTCDGLRGAGGDLLPARALG